MRYYEEIGLLRSARRFAGGRRVYDGDALQRLHFIARLKTLGFSLEEISHLNEVFAVHQSTAEMLAALDGQLARHLATAEEHIRELEALREDLRGYREHIRARREELEQEGGGAPASGRGPDGRAPVGRLWFE